MFIRTSTEAAPWAETLAFSSTVAPDVRADHVVTEGWLGFGGCFNELGWRALSHLDAAARDRVLAALFAEESLAQSCNRLPIGANDYSESWYSHDEVGPGHSEPATDFAMERFSIHRDHRALIPYIRAAMMVRGIQMSLFASPRYLPTWLKFPAANNFDRLIWQPEYRAAYALYFVKFVQAYRALGLPVTAVQVQNEPDSDQKFPSCLWDGERLRDFIRDDLAPAFNASGLECEIWLGTIERGSFNDWSAPTLDDPAAPELTLIQTENECGDGENTWAHAHYVFDLMQHYLSIGGRAYVYWTMVLEPKGFSTWGCTQNSRFSVDPDTRAVTKNPEYHLMRHVAGLVRPGAQVLRPEGRWAANTLAFRNADEGAVMVFQNPLAQEEEVTVVRAAQTRRLTLPAPSFTSLAS